MMKSLSENKRPWSVAPMRCFGDRQLTETDLRVLGALCGFTNRHGVCWPSMATLMDVSSMKSRTSVHQSVKKLKKLRYIRQLNPKDYQETASGWHSNRYQVLWDGDEALPSWEDVQSAKPLQLRNDNEDAPEEIGGLGDRQVNTHTHADPVAEAITHAYLRAVQQATGQSRMFDNEIAHARKLAAAGFTVADVTAATLNVCDSALERRAGVPSLYDVAQVMS
jgi:hypothetical protein